MKKMNFIFSMFFGPILFLVFSFLASFTYEYDAKTQNALMEMKYVLVFDKNATIDAEFSSPRFMIFSANSKNIDFSYDNVSELFIKQNWHKCEENQNILCKNNAKLEFDKQIYGRIKE